MPIVIDGTSGITLPSGSSAVGTSDSQTLTNKTIGSGYAGSTVTLGTSVASTSGTAIDFTSIPSWVKRITVMFSGVSTSGTSIPLVRLGTSGGIESTGYSGASGGADNGAAPGTTNMSIGFLTSNASTAAYTRSGQMVISNISGNTWCATGILGLSDSPILQWASGVKSLSGTLDRVRITTVNGTDTFDAGSINIMYE